MMGGQRELKALLEDAGIRPSKRLGQNFLVDANLMRIIVKEAALSSDDVVLEIGCATGRLTELLAREAGTVYGVEIDHQLAEIARKRLAGFDGVVVDAEDIMESKSALNSMVVTRLKALVAGNRGRHLKVVSNLPYSVGSPAIIGLLLSGLAIELMVVTLQREVARRIAAKAGGKEYGTLSVLAQVFSDVKAVRSIPPSAFWPKPEVSSTILRFDVKSQARETIKDVGTLLALLRVVFGFRRKKLRSAIRFLAAKAGEEATLKLLEGAGIDLNRRGESLSPNELVMLANLLAESPV